MAENHPIMLEIGSGLSLMLGLPTIVSWDSKGRPTNAKRGTIGFNTQTNNLEYWNGEAWLAASMSGA